MGKRQRSRKHIPPGPVDKIGSGASDEGENGHAGDGAAKTSAVLGAGYFGCVGPDECGMGADCSRVGAVLQVIRSELRNAREISRSADSVQNDGTVHWGIGFGKEKHHGTFGTREHVDSGESERHD